MATKIWKEKPSGPEQKELERMFKSNEIDSRELPDSVRQRKEMFKGFGAAVFATHFRKTKAKLGLSVNVPRTFDDEPGIVELGMGVFPPSSYSPITTQNESTTKTSEQQSAKLDLDLYEPRKKEGFCLCCGARSNWFECQIHNIGKWHTDYNYLRMACSYVQGQ